MTYLRELPTGKSQIMKDLAFCDLLSNRLPDQDKEFTELFDEFDDEILKKDPTITKGALSNVHGDWYEWLIAIAAWNFCCTNRNAHFPLAMPNIAQFDVAKLYETKLNDLIVDLRTKVEITSDVKLITSNPDFVILDRELFDRLSGGIELISEIIPDNLSLLDSFYRKYENSCSFNDIIGYFAVKSSLRPDRRLQIPHEGSLMKAIYTHLQTREWIINPPGLKYYAISTKISDADLQALKTVATHSITTVSSLPQAAVDGVFEINSIRQAYTAFAVALSQ